MKNTQKGSITLILSIIILVLVIGFGWYIYQNENGVVNKEVVTVSTPTNTNNSDSLENQLKSIQISFESAGKSTDKTTVNLEDGKYEYQSAACSPNACSFGMNINNAQYKDINNDGTLDALVNSSNWTGGNKSSQSVEVFTNINDTLTHVGSIPFGTTPEYNSLQAENGIITINYNTSYNGAAGWSDPKTFTYKLQNNTLTQVK